MSKKPVDEKILKAKEEAVRFVSFVHTLENAETPDYNKEIGLVKAHSLILTRALARVRGRAK